MTGRELIMYIMQNHLEDVDVYDDNKFIGTMTDKEAAAKFGVGTATVQSWIEQGLLRAGITVGDTLYFIPITCLDPRKKMEDK